MSSIATSTAETPLQAIAPWWHTALVLAIVWIGSLASYYENGLPNLNVPGMSSRLSGYFTVIAMEWVGALLVWLALRRRGMALQDLVGGSWHMLRSFFRDLGLGICFIIVIVPTASGIIRLLGVHTDQTLARLTPKTWFELIVYLLLAGSAAFSEGTGLPRISDAPIRRVDR